MVLCVEGSVRALSVLFSLLDIGITGLLAVMMFLPFLCSLLKSSKNSLSLR